MVRSSQISGTILLSEFIVKMPISRPIFQLCKSPAVTLFGAGDAFTIQGTYDTGVQPVVETNTNGNITLVDNFTADYSNITHLTFTGMSLSQISQSYPSDGTGLGPNHKVNGAYVSTSFLNIQFDVEVFDDFTYLK